MNKSTKYLMVLVGTVALFALALSVVGPAWAQSGTAATPQAGATVALQSGDTLGVLVDRYSLSGDNLRNFLILNSGLKLDAGQTVNFPPDVNVNMGGQGQGTSGGTSASSSTATPAAGATSAATAVATSASGSMPASGQNLTDAQILAFVNMNRGLTFSSGQSVVLPQGVSATVTPAATSAATSAATNTPEATATTAANAQTYTTKDGDTLGTILGFMGFQGIPATGAGAGAAASTNTPAATTAATTAATNTPEATATTAATNTPAATATTAAGGAAGAATATATPAAGAAAATATPAAGANATATPVAGCEANYTVKAGDTLTAIAQRCGITLQQLVDANPNLLQAGSTLNIPARSASTGNVPVTGSSKAQAPEAGFSGLNLGLMPDNVQKGESVYVVRRGDSLSIIARNFNTTVEWLLAHNNEIKNANLIFRGQHLVVPDVETKGLLNYQALERAAEATSAVVPVPSATPTK